jgi:hypothetical protein
VARALTLRRGGYLAALALVLALGGVLRFARLSQRGLIYWDEAKFALEGIRVESLLRLAAGSHADHIAGKAVGTAKPMHALLIALAYSVFGVHDYAALYMDAFAGVACIVLTCVIGRRLFGAATGLIAAGLLAVSEYDVIYARSALSESDATAFFLAGVVVWLYAPAQRPISRILHPAMGKLVCAGVLFGAGLSTNYRLIVYIAALVALDAVLIYRAAGARATLLRLVIWCAGSMVIPVLWQITGALARGHGLVLFGGELLQGPLPYWREVVYQLHQGKQSVLHFNPVIYLQWWVLRQGWLSSTLLLIALVRAIWSRSARWLLPAALVVVPYGVYVFAPFVVPRNLVPALPFASVLVAALLVDTGSRLRPAGTWAVVAALLLLLGLGASASWRVAGVRSGFVDATRYVKEHGGGHALTSSEVPVFYLRGSGPTCDAPAMPYSSGALLAYIREGYHFAILDRHSDSSVTLLIRRVEPHVARFRTLGHVQLGESLISSENSDPPAGDTRTEYVNVYFLDPRRLPRTPDGHAAPCRRDRVV